MLGLAAGSACPRRGRASRAVCSQAEPRNEFVPRLRSALMLLASVGPREKPKQSKAAASGRTPEERQTSGKTIEAG